jgi:hypothetical protein
LASLALTFLLTTFSRHDVPEGLCNAAISLSLANRAVDKKIETQKNSDVRSFFGGLPAEK